jgi:hypothetical protein
MIRDSDGTPVQAMVVLATFPSKAAAARAMGVTRTAIVFAVENGTQSAGKWWRYTDMPASCQPLRQAKRTSVIASDGEIFATRISVVRAHAFGERLTAREEGRELMRLTRAIQDGRKYRGRSWRVLTIEDLAKSRQAVA